MLKNELATGVLPSKYFGANAAWLRLAVISYNVLTALKRVALPAGLLTVRPKRLRFLIFYTAGRLVHHARQMRLRLARETEGSSCGWKPCDSYIFQPNANIGARPYRRICRALFGWFLGKPLSDGVTIGSARPPRLLNLNRGVLALPRAHNKPEFGLRMQVAATY